MRAITKRTAAFSIGIAVFALVGVGCHKQTSSSQASSSAMSSSASATTSAAAEPSTSAAAPTSTQIAGKNGTEYTVEGPILAKFDTLTDDQKKDLGAPYDNQKNTLDNSGVYQQFDGGVLIYRNGGPVYLVWGKIRDAWNENQASQGKLGYPTADEVKEPDGTYKSTFEHGTITWKEGDEKATVTFS
jgi:LGFP repeat